MGDIFTPPATPGLPHPNPPKLPTYTAVSVAPAAASGCESLTQPAPDHTVVVQQAYRILEICKLWSLDHLPPPLDTDVILTTSRITESIRRVMDGIRDQSIPITTPLFSRIIRLWTA